MKEQISKFNNSDLDEFKYKYNNCPDKSQIGMKISPDLFSLIIKYSNIKTIYDVI